MLTKSVVRIKSIPDYQITPRLLGKIARSVGGLAISLLYVDARIIAEKGRTMRCETRTSGSLSKAEILTALSKRLGCSEDNLGFLFERPCQNSRREMDIVIPDAREALRAA